MSDPTNVPTVSQLTELVRRCMLRDRHALRARLRGVEHGIRGGRDMGHAIAALARDVERSFARRAERERNLPRPAYPQPLPVVEKKDEIARVVAANQVVILCGETGSGKTTQLPKICLQLGRGVAGMIGHTQPRRIAARIAQELDTPLGHAVGYKVRFSDKLS